MSFTHRNAHRIQVYLQGAIDGLVLALRVDNSTLQIAKHWRLAVVRCAPEMLPQLRILAGRLGQLSEHHVLRGGSRRCRCCATVLAQRTQLTDVHVEALFVSEDRNYSLHRSRVHLRASTIYNTSYVDFGPMLQQLDLAVRQFATVAAQLAAGRVQIVAQLCVHLLPVVQSQLQFFLVQLKRVSGATGKEWWNYRMLLCIDCTGTQKKTTHLSPINCCMQLSLSI